MTEPHPSVLQGVPVVPGVRFAPVIRANRLHGIDELDPGGVLNPCAKKICLTTAVHGYRNLLLK